MSIYNMLNEFPNLQEGNFSRESCCTDKYNCVAWAAGDTTKQWVPYLYWPIDTSIMSGRDYVTSLILVFQGLGYSTCADSLLEVGYEKVAIYGHGIEWFHAARQLENGKGSSKMGNYEDIEHDTLGCLVSEIYGQVLCLMKRPRAG